MQTEDYFLLLGAGIAFIVIATFSLKWLKVQNRPKNFANDDVNSQKPMVIILLLVALIFWTFIFTGHDVLLDKILSEIKHSIR